LTHHQQLLRLVVSQLVMTLQLVVSQLVMVLMLHLMRSHAGMLLVAAIPTRWVVTVHSSLMLK
jgi:hypothetical protein